MFESIAKFFKKIGKKEPEELSSRDMAKERLQLVLMQDRANVSADFLDMMKQEIIEVIKKYIDVDDKEIDVRLTNKTNEDGTTGGPALYANIPIAGIKQEVRGIKSSNSTENDNPKESKAIDEKTDVIEDSDSSKDEKNDAAVEIKNETEVEKVNCNDEKEVEDEKTNNSEKSEDNESDTEKDITEEKTEINANTKEENSTLPKTTKKANTNNKSKAHKNSKKTKKSTTKKK